MRSSGDSLRCPRCGETRFDGTFSLTDIAGDAARLLDCLGYERACIVGHARGGRAAQVFARDYPHRVSGLVVCGTGGRFPAPGAAERLARLDGARRAGNRDALSAAIEEAYCAPDFGARHPAVLAEIVNATAERPLARGRWDPKIAPTASYWGQAKVPTLLIYGQHDRDGTPGNALDLQARLSAELVMFEDAGHFVVREKEAEVAALLKEFARSVA